MPKVIRNRPDFKEFRNTVGKDRVKKLRLLGSEIIVGIINRTQRGKDLNNKSFKRYTPLYANDKAREFGSSTPNLTVTGNMLNDISQKDIKNGIRLFFVTNESKRKAASVQKIRKFLGIDKTQAKDIQKKLQKL